MKRTERHHLKDNELVNFAIGARQVVEEKSGQLLAVAAAVVIVIGAVIGYLAWRGRVEARAGGLLAEKFLATGKPLQKTMLCWRTIYLHHLFSILVPS